jgi:cytochrome c peroxidase
MIDLWSKSKVARSQDVRAVAFSYRIGSMMILLAAFAVFSRASPALCAASAPAQLQPVPMGLPPLPIPADNRLSAAKIELGHKLFFDRRLSFNGTMSCAMCHIPEQGFGNNELATPIGVEGRSLRRNAPTILNVAYQQSMFHDGRATTLETQALAPLIAHQEMANPSLAYVVAKIAALPDYAGLFEQAFGAGPSADHIGQAIASWERTLIAAESAFDRWYYGGEKTALTARQQHGFELFTGKAGCARCHLINKDFALFTDHRFHNTGIGYYRDELAQKIITPLALEIAPGVVVALPRAALDSVGLPRQRDRGRFEVTLDPADQWRFKTPGLRNIALTAPYMHDGSITTLQQVVQFYNRGAYAHPGLDPLIKPLGLDKDEIAGLIAFLESLTSSHIADLIVKARRLDGFTAGAAQ